MMPRHLLALFALFSGIAALHAPAHASAVQSVVQDARQVARSGDAAISESCACPQQARERGQRCPKREERKSFSWLPSWLRPAVVLGSDRALE
ncbi:hypothetical protein [Qipengyuania nanhaisediminis]|uniref:hypothetical protein n=1 Tax=Qipengyuania nanhaisediminis TaxID=604088 RepID=UPI0038B2E62C